MGIPLRPLKEHWSCSKVNKIYPNRPVANGWFWPHCDGRASNERQAAKVRIAAARASWVIISAGDPRQTLGSVADYIRFRRVLKE
jgi:hypothetical protein